MGCTFDATTTTTATTIITIIFYIHHIFSFHIEDNFTVLNIIYYSTTAPILILSILRIGQYAKRM
jgi:hypothetical protein